MYIIAFSLNIGAYNRCSHTHLVLIESLRACLGCECESFAVQGFTRASSVWLIKDTREGRGCTLHTLKTSLKPFDLVSEQRGCSRSLSSALSLLTLMIVVTPAS